MAEQKKYARVDLSSELRGEVTVMKPLVITQISKGGIRIEMAFPLHLDSLHDFRLTLGDVSVVVKGRIVHCRISDLEQEGVTYRAGVEFIEPPEHARKAIDHFVDRLCQQRNLDLEPDEG